MKRKILLIAVLAILTLTYSCKKGGLIDESEDTFLNEETTFTDSINTTAFLTRIYQDSGFQFDMRYHSGGGHATAADEGVSGRYNGSATTAVTIALGLINKNTDVQQFVSLWSIPYSDIRRVNVFLKNIDRAPLTAATKKNMVAQARFLRAWYYFLLIRAHGGVPIIGDTVYDIADDFKLKRSNYAECVDYIVTECDAAIPDLETNLTIRAQDYGRITKGACQGLKSRVLLYAASPLFNGGQFAKTGDVHTLTGYNTYDKERWKKAVDAALDIINSGNYSLYVDNTTRKGYGFYRVFQMRVNNEYLFANMRPLQREFESFLLPQSRSGGYSFTVSQQIVDRFPMVNGKDITDATSGYNPANPYVNRDPRFANSIIYNQAPWILSGNNNAPVNTFIGSGTTDAVQGPIAFNTSYFPRKMLLENSTGNGERCWPLIRYGEILLNYVEALNEYSGPVTDVYEKLKLIRERAGIDPGLDGLYGMKAGMSQDDMRVFIQNERAIELFMEEHRMWDARRWKTAIVDFTKPIRGAKITRSGTTFAYEYVTVRDHFFPEHYGLFPILESEIAKNTALIQNAGY
ncbi:RagB/SusD family nutrient uptake outer membrane protein [Pedobacter sp. MW01-1-1]|uniref:RagB/SusD family nutrient uptake outer membrane protein n=1 Tax=Pedobacter sp. MW01-1-1 TaxID=3383027 RepID=UPI003FEE9840